MENKSDIEKQKIVSEFLEWFERNLNELPINAQTWNFQLIEKWEVPEHDLIKLGRYKAQKASTTPFYKPYSKTYKF